MTSALFPNQRASAVRGSSARWLELVFLWILLPGQGCHSDFPFCPVPATVCHTAGALEEDLCYCDPTTGVLPPPRCYLMIQSGRYPLIDAVEAQAPEPPPADAGRSVATDSPQPVQSDRQSDGDPQKDQRSLFANLWPAPLTIGTDARRRDAHEAQPARKQPRRPASEAPAPVAELGPQRNVAVRIDLIPPPALPPAPLVVRDDLAAEIAADVNPTKIDVEPLVANQGVSAATRTAPRLAAAPRPVATVPPSVVPDTASAQPRASQPSAPAAMDILPNASTPSGLASTPAAPLDATPADVVPLAKPHPQHGPESRTADAGAQSEADQGGLTPADASRLRDPRPPAPRPEPLRITAAVEPPTGNEALPDVEVLLPVPIPPKAEAAEPELRPAPRPTALNILNEHAPFARAAEPHSGSHESSTSRNDRQRRTASPLQDWEAS